MNTIISFHSSAAPREQLGAIIADYLTLERARRCRAAFVSGFALLAMFIAVAGMGLHWISVSAAWLGVGMCVFPPAWAWIVELRCDVRLARRLQGVPGEVIKNS